MAASNLAALPGWAGKLLAEAMVARMGLLDEDGHPRVLPVTFALAGEHIWSAIDQKPKRVAPDEVARLRFLRRDPRAALTIDRYSENWGDLAWVQVLGEMRIVEAVKGSEGLSALIAKYPQYRASPPPGPLLVLEPTRCLWWRAGSSES